MGADGCVRIYDLELLENTFPDQIEIDDSKHKFYGYHREMFGHKILTQYTDYNYHMASCPVCGISDFPCNHEESVKACLIDEWEVWT